MHFARWMILASVGKRTGMVGDSNREAARHQEVRERQVSPARVIGVVLSPVQAGCPYFAEIMGVKVSFDV
jgi:hypothetical protein